MKFDNWGMFLLAIFLVIYGVLAVTTINFVWSGPIMGLLALASGVLLLMGK